MRCIELPSHRRGEMAGPGPLRPFVCWGGINGPGEPPAGWPGELKFNPAQGVGGELPKSVMKIGFLLPANLSLDGASNGVRAQALAQAAALEQCGVSVALLNPWVTWDQQSVDLVHFYSGGMPMFGIERRWGDQRAPRFIFSPIIDSNESNYSYRLAAGIGAALPKIHTIPGELRRQAAGSGLVICRSGHEKGRIIHGLGINPGKVRVVLNGVNPPGSVDAAPVLARLNLPAEFALHVSSYAQPRKNVVRLAEAIGPTGIPLVIAGTAAPGVILERLEGLAQRYSNIRLLGFMESSDLAALYSVCKVFCLPSLHEGTGLVALDAAAHGAEVVITRNGGPPDYFGRWGRYVDPYDVDTIRRAVVEAWKAPRTGELRRHVLETLTWEKSAQQLIAAYEEILNIR